VGCGWAEPLLLLGALEFSGSVTAGGTVRGVEGTYTLGISLVVSRVGCGVCVESGLSGFDSSTRVGVDSRSSCCLCLSVVLLTTRKSVEESDSSTLFFCAAGLGEEFESSIESRVGDLDSDTSWLVLSRAAGDIWSGGSSRDAWGDGSTTRGATAAAGGDSGDNIK